MLLSLSIDLHLRMSLSSLLILTRTSARSLLGGAPELDTIGGVANGSREVEGPPLLAGGAVHTATGLFMTAVSWLFGFVVIVCTRL